MTTFEITLGVITIIIAIYGSALSTFLYLRDRSAINVKVERGFFAGTIQSGDMLFVEATNVGRRPVVMNTYPALILEDGYQIIITQTNYSTTPRLDEGESLKAWLELPELMSDLKKRGHGIPVAAKFKDSAGREYKYKFKKGEWAKLTKHMV